MKKINIKFWDYFILILFTGFVLRVAPNQSNSNGQQQQEPRKSKRRASLLAPRAPIYMTQIITMIVMLSGIGYEVSIHATQEPRPLAGFQIKLLDDLGVGDAYDRMYFLDQCVGRLLIK